MDKCTKCVNRFYENCKECDGQNRFTLLRERMIKLDGIVRQLDQFGGVVIDCTCVAECMKANPDLSQASIIGAARKKNCLLNGNPDHGNRCLAYPQESTSWLIDSDPQKIKQIPTNDGILRVKG